MYEHKHEKEGARKGRTRDLALPLDPPSIRETATLRTIKRPPVDA
jgi:hypothetical protein